MEERCPNCGANVEGLISRCDCCGAELHPKKTLFSRMTYCTGAFFDIDQYLNAIFDQLDTIPPEPYTDVLERIEFDFWCYPIDKKAGVTYYASRKRAIVTIRVDADAYIHGTKAEKLALLTCEVREKTDLLRRRLAGKNIHMDGLFLQIGEALRRCQQLTES